MGIIKDWMRDGLMSIQGTGRLTMIETIQGMKLHIFLIFSAYGAHHKVVRVYHSPETFVYSSEVNQEPNK